VDTHARLGNGEQWLSWCMLQPGLGQYHARMLLSWQLVVLMHRLIFIVLELSAHLISWPASPNKKVTNMS